MNCFNHNTVPAVGSCKACCKGLCADCACELEIGLACKGPCETIVAEYFEMNERSKKIYGIGKYRSKLPSSGVLMWGAISTLVWIFVAFIYFKTGNFNWEIAVPGIFFTIVTIFAVYSARRTGLNC